MRRPSAAGALALALFAVSFGTNVPTPLLLLYRVELGLSPTMLTVIFATYAAGLVPTLFVAGPASDRYGRRALVIPFAVVSGLASAVFLLAAHSSPLLLVARFLQGMVSGAVFSVGSAWMGELVPDAGTAARKATVALSMGFALGPLSGGLLGQYAPAPLFLPYVVHILLVIAGLIVVWAVPETLTTPRRDGPLLNLGVPASARTAFLAFAVPAGLCVFTFPSVAMTILPIGLQDAMLGRDLAITGVVGGLTMIAGVLVQQVAKRIGAVWAAPLGGMVGAVGLSIGLVGGLTDLPLLLLPAGVLLGAGYGLTLAAGLTATQVLATPDARGALTATFYAVTYLGFGVPVIMSAASRGDDFDNALMALMGLVLVVTAILVVGPGRRLLRRRMAPRRPVPQR